MFVRLLPNIQTKHSCVHILKEMIPFTLLETVIQTLKTVIVALAQKKLLYKNHRQQRHNYITITQHRPYICIREF